MKIRLADAELVHADRQTLWS